MTGSVVGNFKILEKIGEGGMGSVFLGLDIMLDRRVALKMLRPELARDPYVVERFRTEAITLAKISHPRVATLYTFFRERDDFFMVMEYVEGETLESVIAAGGPISLERAIPLFCQALEGIDHAHRLGIVHRDLKPANLMLMRDGSLKVMDFGIARVLGSARMTRTGRLIGTVEYMSPEQVRGREVDSRTDIYSLGIVLYEMLTGRVPFRTDSEYELMKSHLEQAPPAPRTFAPNIPAGVEHAVLRALAKNPDERFATAVEFRTALISTEIAKGGLSDTWFSAVVASGCVKQTRLVERSPGRPASESTDLQNPAALPTREAAPSARKSPPWLKHWAAVRLYVVGLALLGAGGVVAFLLIQQSPTPDTVSKERQSAEPASRPAAPVATPAPASTQTAPPPALVDPAPVQPPYRQDAAAEDRERERRRMAAEKAAKRKAAEKALDLR